MPHPLEFEGLAVGCGNKTSCPHQQLQMAGREVTPVVVIVVVEKDKLPGSLAGSIYQRL